MSLDSCREFAMTCRLSPQSKNSSRVLPRRRKKMPLLSNKISREVSYLNMNSVWLRMRCSRSGAVCSRLLTNKNSRWRSGTASPDVISNFPRTARKTCDNSDR